jgi:hypothetical protein
MHDTHAVKMVESEKCLFNTSIACSRRPHAWPGLTLYDATSPEYEDRMVQRQSRAVAILALWHEPFYNPECVARTVVRQGVWRLFDTKVRLHGLPQRRAMWAARLAERLLALKHHARQRQDWHDLTRPE